jgi:hypothetical protein
MGTDSKISYKGVIRVYEMTGLELAMFWHAYNLLKAVHYPSETISSISLYDIVGKKRYFDY